MWRALAALLAATLFTSCPALAQNAGNVGGYGDDIAIAHTVQNAAYSVGNALGNLETVSIARSTSQPSGIINWFGVQSAGGSAPALTVYAFDASPTATNCTDKSAFSMGAADRPHLIGGAPFVLSLSTVGTGDTATFGVDQNMALEFKNHDAPATTNIYVCVVTGTAFTPASTSDITIKIGVTQD